MVCITNVLVLAFPTLAPTVAIRRKREAKVKLGDWLTSRWAIPSTTNPTAAAGNIQRDRYGVNPPPKMKPNPSEAYKIPTP